MARRHKKHEEHEEHANEERWLVSFADMMTLLMCLFMVLFSISSVNTSKFEAVKLSLQDAFSGRIVSGGKSIMETGSTNRTERATVEPPIPALMPLEAAEAQVQGVDKDKQNESENEEENLRKLKREVDEFAKANKLQDKLQVDIRRRGLVIRLITDGVFFDSGSASLKSKAAPILNKVGSVIARDRDQHPVVVEGYTDSQPIAGRYPSNWELSGARAASVWRHLIGAGVPEIRGSIQGFAHHHPIATNATAIGRTRNRRVEIVLSRINQPPGAIQ